MKLLSLRVADFRGLTACKVKFVPTGVTILEGPNEAGKSSLALALDLLLDAIDSSKSKDVKAVQPVGRDVGPEVEIVAESGDYAFRYRKRFLKRPLTELEVTRPAPEALAGREAHDRVRAILAETMDLDLWKALRIDQGTGVRQPSLEKVPSLMQALEQAAGGDMDPDDDGLLERVAEEYHSFFTPAKGQETKLLKDARAARAEAEGAVAARTQEHDELERDADRRLELERAAAGLREAHAQAVKELATAREAAGEIEALGHAVEKLEPAAQEVRVRLKQVQREHQERLDLAQERDRAAETGTQLDREGAGIAERAQATAQALAAAEGAATESQGSLSQAETTLETRTADERHRREEAELTALRQRRDAVSEAEAELAEARGDLTGNPVDDDLMRRLEDAAAAVETRRAALKANAPSVEVEALDAADVELGDEPTPLATGETVRRTVDARLDVVLPGRLRVSVEAGGNAQDRKRDFESARHVLGRLLLEAGVDTLDAARTRHAQRRTAGERALRLEIRRDEKLAGVSAPELGAGIAALAERVGVYFADRPAEPPLADDLDLAAAAREAAGKAVTAARERSRAAQTERETRRAEDAAAREALAEHERRRKDAEQDRAAAETRLAALREAKSDEALGTELLAVKKEQMEREQALYDRRAELEDKHPGEVQATAERVAAQTERTKRDLRQAEDELLTLGEKLRLRGEEGLFERLEDARRAAAVARRTDENLSRRAGAVRLLYDTLVEERDRERSRYRSPLRTEIETLGREIFGPSFEVELDDDLRVTHRRLDGVTLPLGALSMGAREQLSVITRLACARLVSATGGVPLILDDALGYSDPDRLEAMARVLDSAAKHTQVIVLTCYGERYRHLREATIVRIADMG